jgi:hypothetical protein
MRHFIFNLVGGDQDQARSLLDAKRWVVSRDERHRDAIAPGDVALVFVAVTREFVGRVGIRTTFLDPMPPDPATHAAMSGVLLADVESWTRGVPLAVAVRRIDPHGSNPQVQANAAGFRAGVVEITANEYDIVLSLHDGPRDVAKA